MIEYPRNNPYLAAFSFPRWILFSASVRMNTWTGCGLKIPSTTTPNWAGYF